mmetsp:Transcript_84672/g.202968  ORF Transcript_84672/g.202968 Transcript_84672/m.202968 type:complete len:213 (+) Transcript_84672:57-695(+)
MRWPQFCLGLACLVFGSIKPVACVGDDFDEAVSLEPHVQSVPAHRRAAPPRMHFLTDPAEPEGAPAGQGHEDLVTVLEDRARARHMRSGSLMSQFMRSFAQNMKYAVLQDSKGDMPEEERQRQMRAIEAAKAQQEQQGGSGWSASPREPTHDLALLQHRPRRQPAALQESSLRHHRPSQAQHKQAPASSDKSMAFRSASLAAVIAVLANFLS